MTREQLLEQLYTVRQGLSFIYDKELLKTELENARRKAVLTQKELTASFGDGSKPVSERLLKYSFYAVIMGAFGNIVKFLFLGLWLEGNITELFWYLVASAVLVYLLQKKMRQQDGCLMTLGIVVLLFTILATPLNTIGYTIRALLGLDLFSGVVLGLLSIFIVWVSVTLGNRLYPQWVALINAFIDEENRRLIEENRLREEEYHRLIQRNKEIKEEIEQCKWEANQAAQALMVYGGSWYPKDYYFMDATDFFIAALENFKADTMKELVNLYDDTQYKATQLAYQQEMLMLQKEQLINSQRMAEALRYNNYLQGIQIAQLESIRFNTAEAVTYLKNLRVQEVHNHYY